MVLSAMLTLALGVLSLEPRWTFGSPRGAARRGGRPDHGAAGSHAGERGSARTYLRRLSLARRSEPQLSYLEHPRPAPDGSGRRAGHAAATGRPGGSCQLPRHLRNLGGRRRRPALPLPRPPMAAGLAVAPRAGQDIKAAIGYLGQSGGDDHNAERPPILAAVGAPSGAIALFATSRTIAGVARQFPYQFAHPAGVELASLLARGDTEALHRLYDNASRALAVVVGMLSGFIVIAAPLVLTLWTRGKVAYDRGADARPGRNDGNLRPVPGGFHDVVVGGYPGLLTRRWSCRRGLRWPSPSCSRRLSRCVALPPGWDR